MPSNLEKKIIETRALTAARSAGVPIPMGEIPGEEPDFRFNDGSLGIEVSELLRPASSNSGIMPAAEAIYHKQIVQVAKEQYYAAAHAKPVRVVLHFANARGKKRDKLEMTRALAEFVRKNVHRACPFVNLEEPEIPEGFGHISITTESESSDWWCSEGGSFTVSNIREALASSIAAKNKLLQAYRRNLALGAQVWLLLYSTASVSRGMSIPYGIEKWQFNFDFNKVFWFTSLENQFVEIRRAVSAPGEHAPGAVAVE